MELKVGMYIRTNGKYAHINKITEFDEMFIVGQDIITKNFYECYKDEEISKASFNIIDLIEVGDYVNGYKVAGVYKNKIGIPFNTLDKDDNEYWEIYYFEKDIETILTHEQYEANCFKIGE